MSKFLKYFEKFFEQDGVTYGPNSVSISREWLKNSEKAKEVSKTIQDLWKERVDARGFSKPISEARPLT